jgi:hypothetical protein
VQNNEGVCAGEEDRENRLMQATEQWFITTWRRCRTAPSRTIWKWMRS